MQKHVHRLTFGNELHILSPAGSGPCAPTAILLGWYGASLVHVGKYAEIYLSLGYHVALSAAPRTVVFSLGQVACRPYLEEVLRAVRARGLARGGLVVHAWSNGGAFLVRRLGEIVEEGPATNGLEWVGAGLGALVFDSCPCYMWPRKAIKALSMQAGRWEWVAWCVVFPVYMMLLVVQILAWGNVPLEFWNEMGRWSYGGCKEIYIWSSKDVLCDDAKLNGLVEKRKASGANLVAWRVTDTPHVQIMRWHREKYIEMIKKHAHQEGLNRVRQRMGLTEWNPVQEFRIKQTEYT